VSDVSPVRLGAVLDGLRALLAEATPGPWFYNSYNGVYSEPKCAEHEEFWTDARDADGHSYDHRPGQVCEACGPRYFTHADGKRGQYWDCERSKDALAVEPRVCSVPPTMGDTALGRQASDAKLIVAAVNGLPALIAHAEDVMRRHEPERRWQCHPDCEYSYDTEDEARDCIDGEGEPTYFEVCTRCAELEQDHAPMETDYRESLWPCPEIVSLAAALAPYAHLAEEAE
jgi:hypothetical protein